MDEKPFVNFHSARVKEPNLFAHIVQLQELPNGIRIMGGPLKTDPQGSGKPQAYRFPITDFTVAQSKKWLREHNITWILFEPAEPKEMKQYKSCNIEVKDIDSTKGVVKAYYSITGNIDSDKDIVEPGAGKKTIQERGPAGSNRIKHFKWHDIRYAPGVIQELGEDETGGWFVSKLLKTTLGLDTLIEYEEKAITEHSFGFETIKEDTDESGINHIKEYKLWEVSSLTGWGANPLTRVDYVKDIKDEKQLLKAIETITKYLQIGRFSDGLLSDLEQKYTDLTTIYNSLITNEPKITQAAGEPNKKEAEIKQFYLDQLINS